MFAITSLEHGLAVVAEKAVQYVKDVGRIVDHIVQSPTDQAIIESITATVSPTAAVIERVGFGTIGKVAAAWDETKAGAQSVAISFTAEEAATVSSIVGFLKTELGKIGLNPATAANAAQAIANAAGGNVAAVGAVAADAVKAAN